MLTKPTDPLISGTGRKSSDPKIDFLEKDGASPPVSEGFCGTHRLSFATLLVSQQTAIRSQNSGPEALTAKPAATDLNRTSFQRENSVEASGEQKTGDRATAIEQDVLTTDTVTEPTGVLISPEEIDVAIDPGPNLIAEGRGKDAAPMQPGRLADIAFCSFDLRQADLKTGAEQIAENNKTGFPDSPSFEDVRISQQTEAGVLQCTFGEMPHDTSPVRIDEFSASEKEFVATFEISNSGLNQPVADQKPRTSDRPEHGSPGLDDRRAQPSADLKDRQPLAKPSDSFGSGSEKPRAVPSQQPMPADSADLTGAPSASKPAFPDERTSHQPPAAIPAPKPVPLTGNGQVQSGRTEKALQASIAGSNSISLATQEPPSARLNQNSERQPLTNMTSQNHWYAKRTVPQVVPANLPVVPEQFQNGVVDRIEAAWADEKISELHGTAGSLSHQSLGHADGLASANTRSVSAKLVVQQLAEALTRTPDRPVEVSLNPEELGRVRMRMSIVETSVTVSILAERPESLDLIRRNIDQLAEEFRSLGYDMIGFDFGESQKRWSERPARPVPDVTEPVMHGEVAAMDNQRAPLNRNGLDMRL